MNNSISVIIPFYNGSDYIERALKSVYGQTIQAKEVIVVNDGSKAEEKRFVEHLQKKYGFLLINKENGGQGSARNEGAKVSTADYLCFLDQDDYYLPCHNEVLLEAIVEKEDIDYVTGLHIWADENGNIVSYDARKPIQMNSIFDCLSADLFVLPTATMFKRKSFLAIGGFDEQFTGYEDDDLFIRAFRKGYKRMIVDRPVYMWCINYASTSYSIRMCRSRLRFFKKWADLMPNTKATFALRDCLLPRFYGIVMSDLLDAIKNQSNSKEEIKQIFQDYVDIICQDDSVSRKLKIKLNFISKLSFNNEKMLLLLYRLSHSSIGQKIRKVIRIL